jgi:hypothetical protein
MDIRNVIAVRAFLQNLCNCLALICRQMNVVFNVMLFRFVEISKFLEYPLHRGIIKV